MEIINNYDDNNRGRPVTRARNIYLGTVFILAGALWLLYNLEVIDWRVFHYLLSWQMLLVVTGGYLLTVRKWAAGAIVGVTGLVMGLADIYGFHLPLGRIILPAAIIAIGIVLLTGRK